MPTIINIDFKASQKSFAALPELKDLLKDKLEDLNIPDETLDLLLSFSYSKGFEAAIKDVIPLLESAGITVVEKP